MKFNYYDMLVDQRVANNHLYGGVPSPDEDYNFLFKAGVQYMGLIDVGAAVHVISDTGDLEQLRGTCHNFTDDEVDKLINYLEPYITKYSKLGYLDNMFVYGFDEVREDCVDSITKMFGGIKSKWPNLTTMAAINFIPPITLPLDIWVLQYEFYDGPIATIRLHNFRDGFEDIELLRMLDINTIQQLVEPLVRSPTNFTLDPYLLEQARRKAAELIMKKLQ